MDSEFFIGCDISQDSFNYCLRSKSVILLQGQVENTTKAIKAWLKQLVKGQGIDLTKGLFCMEHTGAYGAILLRVLSGQSLTICVVSAMDIKLSTGLQRGKNDKIDAQRIANYACTKADQLRAWKPKRAVLIRLQLLIRLRERLVKARKEISRYNLDAKRFHLKEEYQLLIKGSREALAGIEKSIARANTDIEALIRADENLKRLCELITSIDGIGMVTCSMILVKTNEFKDFTDPKKFACTAGIAPFEHSSGSSIRGKTRVSHRAHKDLKTLIHMCAVGSISRKGVIQDYYLRKVAEGKNKMSVLNGVRNKLIHIIFAVVKNNVMYQKNYQYNLPMS